MQIRKQEKAPDHFMEYPVSGPAKKSLGGYSFFFVAASFSSSDLPRPNT